MHGRYLKFLRVGLLLSLFTEFELKIVAGLKPQAFIAAVIAYPVILSGVYWFSRSLDRWVSSLWKADVLHYLAGGFGGLAFEWILLGNGPGSNALQLGMFAMWTTFCFGPRVLTRELPDMARRIRIFWRCYFIAGVILTLVLLAIPDRNAKIVIAVFGLSGTYLVWSIWLLVLAWQSQRDPDLPPPLPPN